jgi:hypothetical protein
VFKLFINTFRPYAQPTHLWKNNDRLFIKADGEIEKNIGEKVSSKSYAFFKPKLKQLHVIYSGDSVLRKRTQYAYNDNWYIL